MAHPLILCADDSIADLRQTLKKSDDEKQKTRIRAIISIKEGTTHTETARRFVVHRDTVTNWIRAYNKGGAAALSMSVGGRHEGNPTWDPAIFAALVKEIDNGGYWSVPLMVAWIKTHEKKDIPENTVWYHVRGLNYSYKSARPHPAQGNREKQEAFKKGAWLQS